MRAPIRWNEEPLALGSLRKIEGTSGFKRRAGSILYSLIQFITVDIFFGAWI